MNITFDPSERSRNIAHDAVSGILFDSAPMLGVLNARERESIPSSGFFVANAERQNNFQFEMRIQEDVNAGILALARWIQALPVNTPGIVVYPDTHPSQYVCLIHVATGVFTDAEKASQLFVESYISEAPRTVFVYAEGTVTQVT